jgi:branched-chain amino acid transport system substrate-binding protein
MTMPLFGGDGWEAPELIRSAAPPSRAATTPPTTPRRWTHPKVKAFVAKFKARYDGETPDAMAALGYDSAEVMVDAIRAPARPRGRPCATRSPRPRTSRA